MLEVLAAGWPNERCVRDSGAARVYQTIKRLRQGIQNAQRSLTGNLRLGVIPSALPLVLPPTVLGFYLLLLFAPDTALGSAWEQLTGTRLAFSFSALVIGSVIYSLPFPKGNFFFIFRIEKIFCTFTPGSVMVLV